MNDKDIIIDALCRTIRDKDKYIKELEDAIVYQKGIIDERKKGQNA